MPVRRPPMLLLGVALLTLSGCMRAGVPATATATPPTTFRERIAALALTQVQFGSVSLLPVRFEHSRITPFFEDGGRILYCVTSRMKGRSLFKPERPKVVIREEKGTERLSIVANEDEVCEGHRTEPFPELNALGNRAG
ncbi:hypothetical protein [Methylobacterium iners]|uniref:Lipoprotein n=1 Tax=Methylobacterium iners TaxID=418707 RepID=A0ABQ4RZM1_9HYPH|nr:hypothetical protein [Methylobacterium iners]GJD95073.1 hypothetical protein OCOJLMKI_2282 [Methylobacterium iners]